MNQSALTNPNLLKVAISFGTDRTKDLLHRQNKLGQPTQNLVAESVFVSIVGNSKRLVQEHGQGVLVVTGCPVSCGDFDQVNCANDAIELFTGADGAFAAIYWDKRERSLTVITDFLGVQPLYYSAIDGDLHFASETKAFAADPDPAGWGAFLAFGHPIGDTTLAQGVSRVPGGSILRLDAGSNTPSIQSYWRPPEVRDPPSMTEVADAFRASIQDYAPYGRGGTILLSGGFDSRLVLFGLLEAGISVSARIFSHADENLDADRRFATRLARKHDLDFEVISPADNFFSSSHYLDYLSDTDAQTRSLHLYISQLGPNIPGPAIWEGWGPGPTLGSRYFPGGGFDAYLRRSVAVPGSPQWQAAKLILKPDYYGEMEAGFSRQLEDEVHRYSNDDAGVYWFFSKNRSRNRTGANTFKAFPQYATPCLPGLSKRFWEAAAHIPQREKLGHRYFRRFLQATYPEALKVPFVTGDTLMPGRPFSPYYGLFSLAAGTQRFIARRPRLQKLLPIPGRGIPAIQQSKWLDLDFLAEDDGYINPDAVSELGPEDPLYAEALTFLFHWKAWKALHEAQLHERFHASSSF